jgi:serine/threonine-protein kinase
MTLAPGAVVGPYRITAAIGAGGMGEVYRATDTSLKRQVAIKVLSASFASDADRLARFQREAEVLASLNHPNIAHIYGVEVLPGAAAGAEAGSQARALVMELVEGPTLAELIEGTAGLPIDDALGIARQVADALEAAHERGIIHRDLKPANIKVRPDGTVKVLDFGLAKAVEPAAGPSTDVTQSPTITSPALMTGAGIILGTAAYMAPEQARGKAVDRRADIWAFGCVLFELLTGQRAFGGDDVTVTLARVVEREPAFDALPASVPLHVRQAVRVCLRKDPKRRARDIADVRMMLDGEFEAAHVAPAASGSSSPRVPWWWAAAALVAGLVAAAWLGYSPPAESPSRPVQRFVHTPAGANALPTGSGTLPSISPDGQTLIYRTPDDGVFRLHRRDFGDIAPRAIPGTENVNESPFFSADGEWLGFIVGTTLMKVPLAGGNPQRVAEVPRSRGGAWAADGSIVLAAFEGGLVRVSADGRSVESLLNPDPGQQFWYPQWLPGDRAVLFTASFPVPDGGDVKVFDLETGQASVVVQGASAGRYLASGHLVFLRAGDLWALPFDPVRRQSTGDPVLVEAGVRVEPGGATQMSLAADGTLAYIPELASGQRTLVWVDRTGAEEPLATPPRRYATARVSPDGARIALDVRDQSNDIWIWDVTRQTLTRLTMYPGPDTDPIWMPGGQMIAFSSTRNGRQNLYRQSADVSAAAEAIGTAATGLRATAFSPDGAWLVAQETTVRSGDNLHLRPLVQGAAPRPLLDTPAEELNGEVSPDGRWIAYQSDESGASEIYVRSFPDVDRGRWQVSSGGGRTPAWSPDGSELFYRALDRRLMAARVEPGPAWQNGPSKRIVGPGYFDFGGAGGRTFDVSPDGRRFLMIKEATAADTPAGIVIVQNWGDELRRLLPSN